MPKENRKEDKRTTNETPQKNIVTNSDTATEIFSKNLLELFSMDRLKEFNQAEEELNEVKRAHEELEGFVNQRNNNIEGLKSFVEKKMEIMSTMQVAFNQLSNDAKNLSDELQNEKMKYAEVEIEHDKAMKSLKAQIQELEDVKENVNTIVIAKEAECAAYLSDMKAQLEKSTAREKELENEVSELQAKLSTLEAKVEEQNQTIEEDKEAFDKLQIDFDKKVKKLLKKDRRIKEILEQIQNMEIDNKELERRLEIQGLKMRELQSVLNRPYRHVQQLNNSPENRAAVSPLNVQILPNFQSAPAASPDILLNTQQSNNDNNEGIGSRVLRSRNIPTPRPLYAEDKMSDTEMEDNSSGGSLGEGPPSSNNLKRHIQDSSDEFNFPPFVPSTNQNNIENSFMGIKRFKQN